MISKAAQNLLCDKNLMVTVRTQDIIKSILCNSDRDSAHADCQVAPGDRGSRASAASLQGTACVHSTGSRLPLLSRLQCHRHALVAAEQQHRLIPAALPQQHCNSLPVCSSQAGSQFLTVFPCLFCFISTPALLSKIQV